MPYEVEAPKYVRLAQLIRRRIEDGTYPPGSRVPSENQLVQTSGMSRPTVVRALDLLKRDGWIESRQGFGTVVRGRQEALEQRQRPVQAALERDEVGAPGHVVDVGFVRVPERIAELLDVPKRTMVFLRRFLVEEDGEPVEVVCSYFPKEMIEGTELADPDPLAEGARSHVEARKKVRYDNVLEHVSARPASDDECRLLGLPGRDWLLSVLAAVRDLSGRTLQVVEVLLPPDGRMLDEVYRLP